MKQKKVLNPFHIIFGKCQKVIVTFFSTLKSDCDHYGLSEIFNFFLNLGLVFEKWTFINVLFSKS